MAAEGFDEITKALLQARARRNAFVAEVQRAAAEFERLPAGTETEPLADGSRYAVLQVTWTLKPKAAQPTEQPQSDAVRTLDIVERANLPQLHPDGTRALCRLVIDSTEDFHWEMLRDVRTEYETGLYKLEPGSARQQHFTPGKGISLWVEQAGEQQLLDFAEHCGSGELRKEFVKALTRQQTQLTDATQSLQKRPPFEFS